MNILKVFLLGAVLALPMSTQAQETKTPVLSSASNLDTNKDGKVDAAEMAAAAKDDAGVTDVVSDGAELAKATKKLSSGEEMPMSTMLLVLLGALFKFLLSLVKVLGKNVAWFQTKSGKRTVKYSTLGLGAAAGVVANLGFGMHWMEAAQLVLSGPLAVAIHEYSRDFKKVPSEPEEAKTDA